MASKSLTLAITGIVGGAAALSKGDAGSTSLVFNGTGVPYLAISDHGGSDLLKVMRLNAAGTAWETVGAAGFSSGRVYYPTLALSPAGVPYVSFADVGNGSAAAVMKMSSDP